MAQVSRRDFLTFAKGLDTENNLINEDEGTCSDISNFRINKDGSIQKRGGLITNNPLYDTVPSVINSKPVIALWENIEGNPEKNLYLVAYENFLYAFDASIGLTNEGFIARSRDFSDLFSPGYSVGVDMDYGLKTGMGRAVLFGKYIPPCNIRYYKEEDGTEFISLGLLDLRIRDYYGYDDIRDTPITDGPLIITPKVLYNLENQGYTNTEVNEFYNMYGRTPRTSERPASIKAMQSTIKTTNGYDNTQDGVYLSAPSGSVEAGFNSAKAGVTVEGMYPDNSVIIAPELVIENSEGSGEAATGSKIIKVFNAERKLVKPGYSIKISSSNLISYREVSGTLLVTIRASYIDGLPFQQWFELDLEQENHILRVPKEPLYTQKLGTPLDRFGTPLELLWDKPDGDTDRYTTFSEPHDGPFDFNSTTTEQEYSSWFTPAGSVVIKRNTGLLNEYVMIYQTPEQRLFFVENLVDKLGGTIVEELVVPPEWGVGADETGTFIKVTTEAAIDGLYDSVLADTRNSPKTISETKTIIDGTGQEQEVSVVTSTYGLEAYFVPSVDSSTDLPFGGKFKARFINKDTLVVGLNRRRSVINTIPPEDNPARVDGYFHAREDNGERLYGFDEAFSNVNLNLGYDEDVVIYQGVEPYRPEAFAFYANRYWYAGMDSDLFNGHVFFSQLIQDNSEVSPSYSDCFTKNDPTVEYYNETYATDGGFFILNDLQNIVDMTVMGDWLILFSKEATYVVYGDPYFVANDYMFKKIADTGIVSKGSYSTVGNQVIFASPEGLYTISTNNESGAIEIKSLTDEKLKSWYTSLTDDQRSNIKIDYNKFSKTINVLMNTNSAIPADFYDTLLVYDLTLESFYKYDFTLYENYQILDFYEELNYNEETPLSFFVYDRVTKEYGVFYESSNTHKDFSILNEPFECFLESNYISNGEIAIDKRVRQFYTYVDNKKEGHCNAFIKYNTSVIPTKQWSKAHDVYRLQDRTDGDVLVHKQVCRGEGIFLRFRFESDQEKAVRLLGWTLDIEGNNGI